MKVSLKDPGKIAADAETSNVPSGFALNAALPGGLSCLRSTLFEEFYSKQDMKENP